MSPEKMITMANQIATFFATQPDQDRAERAANHINDFWEPRMRLQLLAHLRNGGAGLHELIKSAQPLITAPATER